MKQWASFLSSGDNKTELIRFLASIWRSSYCTNETEVIVVYTFCVNIRPNNDTRLRPESLCNHEKTDTDKLLHAKQINKNKVRNIADTDVPDWIATSNMIDVNLFNHTSKNNKA